MQTFISKHEGTASEFMPAKDQVSLLLCTNAKDDCMMKPIMLFHSLNPRALKGKNKHRLPVFWRANRKAWVTAAIFMDWLHNCFIPQVEKYLVEKKKTLR